MEDINIVCYLNESSHLLWYGHAPKYLVHDRNPATAVSTGVGQGSHLAHVQ